MPQTGFGGSLARLLWELEGFEGRRQHNGKGQKERSAVIQGGNAERVQHKQWVR